MYKLFLFLTFTFLSVHLHASCCSFELAYIPGGLYLPDEANVLSCIEKEGCDSLFLFVLRMTLAENKEDLPAVINNFERALPLIEKRNKKDTTSLKIIYLYASFLERLGESSASAAYYQFIEENSSSETALNILAKIGVAGAKESVNALESAKALVVKAINAGALSTDEILAILIRITNYFDPIEGYEFSQISAIASVHSLKNLDPDLYYIYLDRFTLYLHTVGDKRFESFYSKAQVIYNTLPKEDYYNINLLLKIRLSNGRGQYDDALMYSKKRLQRLLEPSESLETITTNPPRYNSKKYSAIHTYASSNLYQTRVRPGLNPVKTAFDLFELYYKEELENRLTSVSDLIADKFSAVYQM